MGRGTVDNTNDVENLHTMIDNWVHESIDKPAAHAALSRVAAQRDRALEAVEKLGGACEPFRNAFAEHGAYQYKGVTPEIARITDQNVITPRGVNMGDFRRLYEALAVTEPATVELPKCDHCGAIARASDCDGSSHYTPDCHP
jgi:hypothetical protein